MNDFATVWNAGLRANQLQLPQCTACDTWNWYPLLACRECGATTFAWRTVAPTGSLHSWTRVHRRFTARALPTPYLVGLVSLDQAPAVRITCQIVTQGADPVIGAGGRLQAVCTADASAATAPAHDEAVGYWRFDC